MIFLRLIHGRIKAKRCSNAGMNFFLELWQVRTDYSAQKLLYNWGLNILQCKVTSVQSQKACMVGKVDCSQIHEQVLRQLPLIAKKMLMMSNILRPYTHELLVTLSCRPISGAAKSAS